MVARGFAAPVAASACAARGADMRRHQQHTGRAYIAGFMPPRHTICAGTAPRVVVTLLLSGYARRAFVVRRKVVSLLAHEEDACREPRAFIYMPGAYARLRQACAFTAGDARAGLMRMQMPTRAMKVFCILYDATLAPHL